MRSPRSMPGQAFLRNASRRAQRPDDAPSPGRPGRRPGGGLARWSGPYEDAYTLSDASGAWRMDGYTISVAIQTSDAAPSVFTSIYNFLKDFQTLIAGIVAFLGAAAGVLALHRQTLAQASAAQAVLAHADAREQERAKAERAALASLLHADLSRLAEDCERFLFSIDNAQATGITGKDLARELAVYARPFSDFDLALNWRDLSRLDVSDVMKVRALKHLHSRLVREIAHQVDAIELEVPLFGLRGMQIDAEESALTAVSERAQDLQSEIEAYNRELMFAYGLGQPSKDQGDLSEKNGKVD